MRAIVLVAAILLMAMPARASHIVGGEFEMIYLGGNLYRINLILYFDEKHGAQGAKDPSVTIRIFRKRDNFIMINGLQLNQSSFSNVNYTQPECSKGEIITSKIVYSNTITLNPEQFNDQDGYYMAWERCCRNYSIKNIYSEVPTPGSRSAGQTFYLEFPPLMKNGERFINSSPRLFPPLNDYGCPGRTYYVDFAGTDDDGDSLVYSLVTPLTTFTIDALPPGGLPRPGPYPEVQWRPGYSLNNIIGGNPDLKISDDGFLTVTPPPGEGLYVFAVKCEEFRDGVKIGEVRRDFQMFVVSSCPVADPPKVVGRKKGTTTFGTHGQPLSLSFAATVSDQDRCVEVRISDLDSQKPEDNFQEKIRIRVFPLNFKHKSRYLTELHPAVTTATLTNGGTADFTICLPACPYTPDGNYQIGVIAYDDACSLPLSDTLKITVYTEPPPNTPPQFTTGDQSITINEGDPIIRIPFEAVDADNHVLDVFMLTNGFELSNVGMTMGMDATQPGRMTGEFTWDSRCDVFDFTRQTDFTIKVWVEDRDKCLLQNPDTLTFDLAIILPGNSDPVISSSLQTASEKRIEVTRKIYESLQFSVTGTDADNDLLKLGVTGKNFTLNDVNAAFSNVQGRGTVSSPFRWSLNCDKINLDTKNKFEFMFIVVDDANKCRFYKADTLQVIVHVEPPDNIPPQLVLESLNPDQPIENGTLTAILGSEIRLKLTGTDGDLFPVDLVSIDLIQNSSNLLPEGYVFTQGIGLGKAEAFFNWEPDCSIFINQIYENEYRISFSVFDHRCFNQQYAVQELNLIVRDVDGSDDEFLPPNLITPDGNGKNEFFGMVAFVPPNEYMSILPKDNCLGSFVYIRIYDRWGNSVFQSSDRDFRWQPKGIAAGVYFYHLTFTHKIYKGTVSVKY